MAPRRKPVIECRGLWKVFAKRPDQALDAIRARGLRKAEAFAELGAVIGVRDVSFSVRRGEIFCIMGLSGCGKSSLIRHVNRLIEPTAGQVLINGEDVNQLSAGRLRKLRAEKIGMVFQNMALMPHRNIIDNVAFGLETQGVARREREMIARQALDAVELDDRRDCYPDELSGGMKQRVGLARAVAADPDILLMDEPFSALDPLIRRQLQDEFLNLSTRMKKTTLFITHDLDEAIRIGDRIAIMKDGEIIQVGTPEAIATEPKDDYVADFVAGISKLNLIRASTVMTPVEAHERRYGRLRAEACSVASPDDPLDKLIELAAESDHPILIRRKGKLLGVVSKRKLLRGIRGQLVDDTVSDRINGFDLRGEAAEPDAPADAPVARPAPQSGSRAGSRAGSRPAPQSGSRAGSQAGSQADNRVTAA